MDELHDVGRRPGREDEEERRPVVHGIADLLPGRHVGEHRVARGLEDRQHPHAPGLHVRPNLTRLRHQPFDVAAEQRGAALAPAREGDMGHPGVRQPHHLFEVEVARGPLAGRADADLAGAGLGSREEFLGRLPRRVVLDDQQRIPGHEADDRDAVVRRPIRQVHHLRLDHEIGQRHDAQRVAVRLGLDHLAGADGAAGPGPDDHGDALRKLLLHALGERTHRDVGQPAGRIADDRGDWPLRILAGGRDGGDQDDEQGQREADHGVLQEAFVKVPGSLVGMGGTIKHRRLARVRAVAV